MTKLEKAKKQIEIDYFNHGIDKLITKENALKAVEIASETDWKHVEKNLPENNKKVLCLDFRYNHKIGFHKDTDKPHMFIDDNSKYFFCISWTELPKFL